MDKPPEDPVPSRSDSGEEPTTRLPPESQGVTLGPHEATSPRLEGSLGAEPVFSPGRRLAGRFRVIRFVARGGMGEVYEAEDEELSERVALKTFRPEIAQDARAMERFRREVQLSRRVTHPNVCRIFDIFRVAEPEGEVAFLTMELLQGATLAERIQRQGRIPAKEALPLVRQMAAGLTAAHKAGVIHRDFKSSNVLLVPATDEPCGLRAVITDFGLARGTAVDDQSVSLTDRGWAAGTPAYMAPEQVSGGAITPATDIYALGVVLYEVVTGERPFSGSSALSTAAKRLTELPPSPGARVANLDPRWERAILRCLERDPADRYRNAAEVVLTLEGAPEGRRPLSRRRLQAVLGGVGVALLLAAMAWLMLTRHPAQSSARGVPAGESQVPKRRSVAVLGFKNLSARAEDTWLSTALAETLASELAAGEKLHTIPGENVARMKADLSLPDGESLAPDTLRRIHALLGADLVVFGSYLAVPAGNSRPVRVDLRVQDTAAGETVATLTQSGTEAELLELVTRVGTALRGKLGLTGIEPKEAEQLRAALPSDPETAHLYSEGLEKLRRFDALGARDALERAVERDSRYALAHSALAEAWSALGYDARARAEAERAIALSAPLSREQRLAIEGLSRRISRQWARAVEIYRTLWNFFPDNPDYGLKLAQSQVDSSDGRGALQTVEALRRASQSPKNPRMDLTESEAALGLSDYRRALQAADRAAENARALGMRSLEAIARLMQGDALWRLGDPNRSITAYDQARSLFQSAGDRRGVVRAISRIANVRWEQGDAEASRRMHEESLAVYREIGDESGVASELNNLAILRKSQGDLAEAQRMYEESLRTYRKIGDRDRESRLLNNLASLLETEGKAAPARALYEQSLAIKREIGSRGGVGAVLNNLADQLLRAGDLMDAQRSGEEALRIFRELADKHGQAQSLYQLAEVRAAAGDLAGAREKFQASLTLRQQLGEEDSVTESLVALARLALEEGDAQQAETAARAGTAVLEKAKAIDEEGLARELLARSLLLQGKLQAAREVIGQAEKLTQRSRDRHSQLFVSITEARLAAAEGRPLEAKKRLEETGKRASQAGWKPLALEARLAGEEIGLTSGDPAARVRLRAIKEEAAALGLARVAQRAGAASR